MLLLLFLLLLYAVVVVVVAVVVVVIVVVAVVVACCMLLLLAVCCTLADVVARRVVKAQITAIVTNFTLSVRLVPTTFLLYHFSLLLFVACFTAVFAVDNDGQKRNLIGTDRTHPIRMISRLAWLWLIKRGRSCEDSFFEIIMC
jgi:hypothetical protein